jgi:hypothetical protein
VDTNYSNGQNEFLWGLLANPANDAHLYTYNLQRLVNDFPQSGILQALLAHASDDKNLKQASVYFNAKSLYKLINSPTSLTGVPNERIIVQSGLQTNGYHANGYAPVHQDIAQSYDQADHENYFSDTTVEAEHDTEHHEDLPAVIHHTEEDLPAVIHDHEIADEETPSEHHYLADTLPVVESFIPPAAEEFIGHRYDEFKPTVSTYIHPVEDEVEHKTEEANQPAAEYTHPVTEAHENANSYIHQAEDTFEQKAGEVHDALSSYTHPSENIAEEASAYIHPAEETVEHKEEESVQYENASAWHQPVPEQREDTTPPFHPAEPEMHHQEQVFDEFTGNISTETPHYEPEIQQYQEPVIPAPQYYAPEVTQHQEPATSAPQYYEPAAEYKQSTPEPAPFHAPQPEAAQQSETDIRAEEEKLISGGMASADFFAFNRAYEQHSQPEPAQEQATPLQDITEQTVFTPKVDAVTVAEEDDNQHYVSRYNDEKMPYTFMWWLDKTRKEHSGVFQPYVEAPKPINAADAASKMKTATDELQQQYYENIFHITSVDELDKNTISAPYNPPPNQLKKKEQVIIERFIKEEPIIKPQSSEKIDNENKAKKSSEDRDELVTETLAAIYSDQMLYHKAIASYKKLVLKFPEKSRYFADKIEALEKKTN